MPIIDLEIVGDAPLPAAQPIADALGALLGTPPGRTWLRVRRLPADCYAENDGPVTGSDLPVFVTVLHADPPAGAARVAEMSALTAAIARALACDPACVHVQYAPAEAGRQAFGGRLVE